MKNNELIISKILKDKILFGIVHGERVDKAKDLTIENFERIDFIGTSVNVKKKEKVFFHAVGRVGGKKYFLIFQ